MSKKERGLRRPLVHLAPFVPLFTPPFGAAGKAYTYAMAPAPVLWKDFHTENAPKKGEGALVVPLGTSEAAETVSADLYQLRNLLVCGVADSGKTALVHSILNSLIAKNSPDEVRFLIIDPKQLEFQPYDQLLHLLTPVMSDAKKAVLALKWLQKEAERRLSVLKTHRLRNIEEYHARVRDVPLKGDDVAPEKMPYIVVVLDELPLLMKTYPREIASLLGSLVPHAKASGIHLIITTSRFDAQVLPVALRDHFQARIAFHLSGAQSRLFLGDSSAESLRSRGAAVFRAQSMDELTTFHAAFITNDEIDAHTEWIARKYPSEKLEEGLVPVQAHWFSKEKSIFDAMDEESEVDRYQEAVEAVREVGKASTSYLQRKLGIGYSRAAHLMDLLEERGVIRPGSGSAPRDVIDE